MKVPLSWLKEYINTELPPIEIAKILTMAGLEVDAIEKLGSSFSGVFVAKVLSTEKHPDADKLCVAEVSDGQKNYQVVCGASNCRPGLITAFAKEGAALPDEGEKPFKVKKSKIRGVDSYGMLCSGKELKISSEEEGILELDASFELGADFADLCSEVVFEISLTPNLGHCANVFGVARELHAATEKPLQLPKIVVKEGEANIEQQISVEVYEKELCPRYTCRLIKGVTIAPSPQWLQNRLIASGLRPINNIVDITNYVLLELGHPLHAFDYDLLKGQQIIVRQAANFESFTTLDGKERLLHHEDLMICDVEKPIAIAGVMGGKNSEVSATTQNILLEAAFFCPKSIRRTSKRIGLMTDASRRFERGCDPNLVVIALNRAAMLVQQIAGGEVSKGIIDIKQSKFEEKSISCRLSKTNNLLGTNLRIGEVESLFRRLGFTFQCDGEDLFEVSVPTYRCDISQEVDLIEEVARLYGYENLHRKSAAFHSSERAHSEVFLFEREIRSRMISEGLQEFLTCDLIGPSLLEIAHGPLAMEDASLVKVLNPTSIEQSCLRTSLLPGLLQVVKYNHDHQNRDISGFEIGRVHFKRGEGDYHEDTVVGIIQTGHNHPYQWEEKPRELDFFDLKGIAENMLEGAGIGRPVYKNNNLPYFHTGRQASIYIDQLQIGTIGEVHPSIARQLGVSQRIFFAEFNLQDLHNSRSKSQIMQAIPAYPSSERDWTLTLKEEIAIDSVFEWIYAVGSRLLESCQLRDIYRSNKIGEGCKNVTLRFIYRDMKKTIAQESVDREHARITDRVRSLIPI